jgi:hypothetical protein
MPVPVVVVMVPPPPVSSPPWLLPELLVLSPHPAQALATVAATTINPKILVLRIISS